MQIITDGVSTILMVDQSEGHLLKLLREEDEIKACNDGATSDAISRDAICREPPSLELMTQLISQRRLLMVQFYISYISQFYISYISLAGETVMER